MTAIRPRLISRPSGEIWAVSALALLGGLMRFWSPGRLGMIHFDEGIYALAGLWSLSPRGLSDIDPMVISYAPPGYPIAVGLSYLVFNVNDLAAILVSIAAGTLTIPVAAWLSRRTFGPGAGGAAAAFTAFSGPHIAFSRMALTDASFLFFWLVAIGMGQRFVERPNPVRALWLGIAVGVAQLFKYNGWISGAIVAAAALVWLLFHREEWRTRSAAATSGWGLMAAVVAALVYWPWFGFVDSHGGYGALLLHQRRHLGGLSSWPGHWSLQLAQERFLSGGAAWVGCVGLAAAVAMMIGAGDFTRELRHLPRLVVEMVALMVLGLIGGSSWWIVVAWVVFAATKSNSPFTKSTCVMCAGWASLSVLTPFYHPYARLWLPVEAFGWLLLGGAFVSIRSNVEMAGRGARWTWGRASDPLPWFTLFCVLSAVVAHNLHSRQERVPLLGPSDSLRLASRTILNELPPSTNDLSAYARPSLLFYLAAGNVMVHRQPDLAHLLDKRNSTSWALLDLALIRQQNISKHDLERLLADWTVVREVPTTLNAPTLLDIDPAAATADIVDTGAPLWLLRRKRLEDVR